MSASNPTPYPTLEFSADFPEALIAEVEMLFAPFLWLARDMKKLYISLKGSSDEMEGESAICTLSRYHVAHITLDPTFWALSFEDKEIVIIHELFHIITDDFTRKVVQALDAIEDEKLKRHLYAFLSDAEEELVDRLAWDFYVFVCGEGGVRRPKAKKVNA